MLALAEASVSRMTPGRARALAEQGARNAAVLERIENEPARYLNSVYLSVMFVQNGSAVLVARSSAPRMIPFARRWRDSPGRRSL